MFPAKSFSHDVEETAPELCAGITVDDEINSTVEDCAKSCHHVHVDLPSSNVVESLLIVTFNDARDSVVIICSLFKIRMNYLENSNTPRNNLGKFRIKKMKTIIETIWAILNSLFP